MPPAADSASPHRVVVTAELGINHNGKLGLAKQLATVARDAGCDYVKLQKRNPEWCYSPEELARPCESPWGTTVGDKVRARELSWDDVHEFDKHCRAIGIKWFASCFDLHSLRKLHEYFPDRDWNKVAGCMVFFPEFLAEVAAQGKPTMISCAFLETPSGSSNRMTETATTFERAGCAYVLMHCQPIYPCDPERLNLNVVRDLPLWKARGELSFPSPLHCLGIGYSGHESGVMPSVVAAVLGARWIERHITIDRTMYGADQAASLEPDGLRRLVRDLRSLETIMGNGEHRLRGDEKRPVTFFRKE